MLVYIKSEDVDINDFIDCHFQKRQYQWIYNW